MVGQPSSEMQAAHDKQNCMGKRQLCTSGMMQAKRVSQVLLKEHTTVENVSNKPILHTYIMPIINATYPVTKFAGQVQQHAHSSPSPAMCTAETQLSCCQLPQQFITVAPAELSVEHDGGAAGLAP